MTEEGKVNVMVEEKKTLFVHDGPLFSCDNKIYGNQFNNQLVERYTFFSESISFLMRNKKIKVEDLGKYTEINHQGFQFISFPNFKSLKTLYLKSRARRIIRNAVANSEIIVVRLPSTAGAIAFEEAVKLGKPILIEFVACVFDALWNYNWQGKILAWYKYFFYRKLMRKATHTIYVTNAFLQSRYPSINGKSIGCSDVELQKSDDFELKRRLEKAKAYTGVYKLVTVAAIDVVYKGHTDVIRALANMKGEERNFQYEIIGQGDPTRLQRMINDLGLNNMVKIIGSLPHNQVFDHLKDTDIYIQPSFQEGLPRAVIEAMSVGCPVIGTNVGGIPELIAEECIYEKGNINMLVEKLEAINSDFLIRNAKRNFEKSKNYEKKRLDAKREAFYDQFLADYNISK